MSMCARCVLASGAALQRDHIAVCCCVAVCCRRDDASNESYESWRHALHAAFSHTRYSLASFITTAASILPSRQRQPRPPFPASPHRQHLTRQGLEMHDRAHSLGPLPRQAVIPVSPSAPVLMGQGPVWQGMSWEDGDGEMEHPGAGGMELDETPDAAGGTAAGALECVQSAPADFDMASPEGEVSGELVAKK